MEGKSSHGQASTPSVHRITRVYIRTMFSQDCAKFPSSRVVPQGWCFGKGAHFRLVDGSGRSGPFCCIQMDYLAHMKIRPELSKQILMYPTSGHCREQYFEVVY